MAESYCLSPYTKRIGEQASEPYLPEVSFSVETAEVWKSASSLLF